MHPTRLCMPAARGMLLVMKCDNDLSSNRPYVARSFHEQFHHEKRNGFRHHLAPSLLLYHRMFPLHLISFSSSHMFRACKCLEGPKLMFKLVNRGKTMRAYVPDWRRRDAPRTRSPLCSARSAQSC